MLGCIERAGISRAQLAVRPAAAPAVAAVSLSVQGQFSKLTELLTELSAPSTGVVLRKVRLSPGGSRTLLDLEAVALGGRS